MSEAETSRTSCVASFCASLWDDAAEAVWSGQNQPEGIPQLLLFGSRLISDTFPKIIPAEFSIKAEIIRRELEVTFLRRHQNV